MDKQLNEALSLMNRMNLYEGVKIERKQVGRNDIIDILDAQDETNAGCYVSLTYVTGKSFYGTKRSWRTDDMTKALKGYGEEGNEHWYPQIKQFNDDSEGNIKKLQGIAGIIMVTRYVLHWTTEKNYGKAYGAYADKLRDLRMRNGVGVQTAGILGDPMHQVEKNDASSNVVTNTRGDVEKRFNAAGSPASKSKFYVIGTNGQVIGEIPSSVVNAMSAPFQAPKPEKAVTDVLSGEALELYMKEKAELDKTFQGKSFNLDKILSIVATVNGKPYYYINDMAKVEVKKDSGLFVSSNDLVEIAKKELSNSFDEIVDYDPLKI